MGDWKKDALEIAGWFAFALLMGGAGMFLAYRFLDLFIR